MKFLAKTANFFGGLIAFALSIALIFVLLATSMMFAAQMTMTPETLQQIVVGAVETAAAQAALNPQLPADPQTEAQQNMLRQLMESEAAKELLALYVEDFFDQMQGERGQLRSDTLIQLAKEHMDELLPIVRQLAEQTGVDIEKLSDRQLEAQVMEIVEEYGSKLMDNLPTPQQLGMEPLPEVAEGSVIIVEKALIQRVMNMDFRRADLATLLTQMVLFLNDYWGLKFLGLVVAALSLAILLCRIGGGWNCFSWLATNYLLGGCFVMAIGGFAKQTLSQIARQAVGIPLGGAFQPILTWLLIAGGAFLVLGILFAVISAKGDSWFTKRRKN